MNKEAILRKHPPEADRLLLILHDLQAQSGHNSLTADDLAQVAEYVGLTASQVHDAVTFYSMFSMKARGRHVIRLCDSPHCHLAGSWSVLEELKRELGVEVDGTTADGAFTLELTSCLGVCGVAPAMMIDDEMVGNLTPERVRESLARYGRDA